MACPFRSYPDHVPDEDDEDFDELPPVPVAIPEKRKERPKYDVVKEAIKVVRQTGTVYSPSIPSGVPVRNRGRRDRGFPEVPPFVPPAAKKRPPLVQPVPVAPYVFQPWGRAARVVAEGLTVARQKVSVQVPRFVDIPLEVLEALRSGREVKAPEIGPRLANRREVPKGLAGALAEEAVTQELEKGFDIGGRLVPAFFGAGGAVGGGLIFNAARRMKQLIGQQPAQRHSISDAPAQPF